MVLRANKTKFEQSVEELSTDVAAFAEGVKNQIDQQINESCKAVVTALHPAVDEPYFPDP